MMHLNLSSLAKAAAWTPADAPGGGEGGTTDILVFMCVETSAQGRTWSLVP